MCLLLSDGWNNSEKQRSLLWRRNGFGAVTQRKGKIIQPLPFASPWHLACYYFSLTHSACHARLVVLQCFGIAEGRPKEDLKNMANASGMACREYTPPGGETFEQVSRHCAMSPSSCHVEYRSLCNWYFNAGYRCLLTLLYRWSCDSGNSSKFFSVICWRNMAGRHRTALEEWLKLTRSSPVGWLRTAWVACRSTHWLWAMAPTCALLWSICSRIQVAPFLPVPRCPASRHRSQTQA